MTMRNVLYFVAGGCLTWLVFGGDRSTPKNQVNVSSDATFKSKQAIAKPKRTHCPIHNGERKQNQRHDATKPASSRDSGLIVLTLVFIFLGAFAYWLSRTPLALLGTAFMLCLTVTLCPVVGAITSIVGRVVYYMHTREEAGRDITMGLFTLGSFLWCCMMIAITLK